MSGKTDQVKGRIKEAAGVLTGDKRLERDGKIDRVGGSIKSKAGAVAHGVEEKAKEVVGKVKSAIKR